MLSVMLRGYELGPFPHNKDIGEKLGIAESTVKVYLARLSDKLGVTGGRLNLALWARDHREMITGAHQ